MLSTASRFVVYGAGAVGGVVGARLFQHGHSVVLVARGRHYETMRRDGLQVVCGSSVDQLAVSVVDDPGLIDPEDGDVIVVAVKSQDTEEALRAAAAVFPSQTPVFCAQNGVANERTALRYFENVYGICVSCPAGHLAPGVVHAYASPLTGGLEVGRYPSGVDETAETVAAVLSTASFHSRAHEDIMRWKYRKLLQNLGNAAKALCGRDAPIDGIVATLRDEGERVLDAARIPYLPERDYLEYVGPLYEADKLPASAGSTLQSLQRGLRSVETYYLNGEIVLLGRLHGVETPANSAICAITTASAQAGRPPGRTSVEELRRLLPARA